MRTHFLLPFLCLCFVTFRLDNLHGEGKHPIVFIHGMLASSDTYSRFSQYFQEYGYSADQLHFFDWNTLNRSQALLELQKFIDQILYDSGFKQVVMVGHSAGGGIAYQFMNLPENHEKIYRYVHIGSSPNTTLPGNYAKIPTLNLYSKHDYIVRGGDIPGAINKELHHLDHYEVATSYESFRHIIAFLHSETIPAIKMELERTKEELICHLSGRIVKMGENTPVSDAQLEIFENYEGKLLRNMPIVQSLVSDSLGRWGPVSLRKFSPYIFCVREADSDRDMVYFFDTFTSDDPLVYLRTLPAPNTLPGMLFSRLPRDDHQSVLSIFSANKAFHAGRDTLTINGKLISTLGIADEKLTTIAIFLYDDGDKKSSGDVHPQFRVVPFMKGMDVFLDPENTTHVLVRYNDRKISIPLIPSSQGVQIAVFR
ncbi:MAG TPA: hypothetical protein PKC30_07800 [Saprospiraceae bacterium]|nr:hypothetical protein [Saprospiraceae bacterium]